jgi:Kef-type K+ transport system membrane component KefB/Trk K+ transport system NAD-binding subunit
MEETQSFVPLLIVIALAFVVPLILSRFKRLSLPMVVGEILAGIVIGDSGFKLVGETDPILEILALLGFAYLMFLSGLEVDFDAILPRPGTWQGSWREKIDNPLSLGIAAFGITIVIAFGAALALQKLDATDDPYLMALILSTTSLGLVMPVLKERGLTKQPYGQLLLVAAVIADFVTMLLVSVYVVLHTEGLSLNLLLILILFGVFGTAYRLARLAHPHFLRLGFLESISTASAHIDVRGAFAVALAFIALAQGLGVEMILGAFLGGALISLLADRQSTDLYHRLDVIGYAFLVPIFFVMVGVRFDLASLLSSSRTLLLVPILLLLAYGVKLAAALVYRVRHPWRETLAAGTLLSSRLSLIIAVSAIGMSLGSIDSATNAAIILMAIVTSTVSPLIFNRLAPEAPAAPHKFVIVGAGRLSRLLARRIAAHGEQVVVIDRDPGRAATVADLEVDFVQGDASDRATWEAVGPETVRAVATLLPEDRENLQVAYLVREELGIEQVVARIHDATQTKFFSDLKVGVVNPSLSAVVEMEYLLLYPTVSALIGDLDDDYDIVEVQLGCPDFTGRPLRDLQLPEGAMVVLVRRNGDVIFPRGHTELQLGDHLTLMGSLETVRELARECE